MADGMPPLLSTAAIVELLDSELDNWNQARVRKLLRGTGCRVKLGGRVFASTARLRERIPDVYQEMVERIRSNGLNGKHH